MCTDGVDFTKTYSNSCVELFNILGKEAACAAIMKELRGAILLCHWFPRVDITLLRPYSSGRVIKKDFHKYLYELQQDHLELKLSHLPQTYEPRRSPQKIPSRLLPRCFQHHDRAIPIPERPSCVCLSLYGNRLTHSGFNCGQWDQIDQTQTTERGARPPFFADKY